MRHFYFTILVIVFGFTITTSCSSDDDEMTPVVEPTFLELHQGTLWQIAINEFNSEYLMFHNDASVPFEQWLLIYGAGCYEHSNYKLSDFDATITENTEEYLEITFNSGHVWLFAVEEDLMIWVDVTTEGIYNYIYEKQDSAIVDDLVMCTQ
ncbi:hypothetical protein E7Z59_00170 [Robertkochia marina]|uniref:Uncharacterized protein n=1 Tax=Robertkochia marina TaxID=1227945 RepID=A0A4S3M1S5_9FLAO|nr:hypothetical protein [Robertkochia marina]THD68780.1 hypothetical protein E7Z59_00170 [Robertkochia marina]TRZ43853.1 hypothetical protein D3A96_09820 [Robertkochia marina]